MKTNNKHEVIARIARGSLGLAALLALMLSAAGVGRAQSSATPAPAAQVGRANTAGPTGRPAAKGQHEGITVHGRWVIEVKNPDGTVTARREFENALQFTGEQYLAALLSGNNSPGGLSILLNGAHAAYLASDITAAALPITFSQLDPGPCLPLSVSGTGGFQSGGQSSGTTCLITTTKSYLGPLCLSAQTAYASSTKSSLSSTSPCSSNLSVLGDFFSFTGGAVGQSPQVVLSGSVTATTSLTGQNVNDVETVFTTCDGAATPLNCVNIYNPQTQQASGATATAVNLFTQRMLDGNSPTPAQAGDPNPVPYTSGQVIAVTVTFSFQ